jgi:Tyrosyl-DNA phosphodiesterase
VQDQVTKQPKLNCRNWECGVILPMPKGVEDEEARSVVGSPAVAVDLDTFASSVPIPMERPGESFTSTKKQPWFFGG